MSTKRKLRIQRPVEEERPISAYTDNELNDAIAAAFLAIAPGTPEGWAALKALGPLIREKARRKGQR